MTDILIYPPYESGFLINERVAMRKQALLNHDKQTQEQKRAAKAQQAFISAPILGKQNEH